MPRFSSLHTVNHPKFARPEELKSKPGAPQ
jgi:hypothetical protein